MPGGSVLLANPFAEQALLPSRKAIGEGVQFRETVRVRPADPRTLGCAHNLRTCASNSPELVGNEAG